MDFRSLRCFVMVAEELHVTRAAERLHMAQPALTRLLQHLEEELGFALFDRSNKRQIALTPAGQAFLDEITPLLSQYERAIQVARGVIQGAKRKLVVGYGPTAMLSGILPKVMQVYEAETNVELVLRDLSTQSYKGQIKALREQRLDVLFMLVPFDEPGLGQELVSQTSMRAVLPAMHRLAHLSAIPLAALAQDTWIIIARQIFPRFYDEFVQQCQQAGFEPRIVRMVPQAQAIVSLVAAQVGVSLLNEWGQQTIQQQGVVYRPFLDFPYQATLYMLWRQNDPSPLVQTFLQVVRTIRREQEDANGSNEASG